MTKQNKVHYINRIVAAFFTLAVIIGTLSFSQLFRSDSQLKSLAFKITNQHEGEYTLTLTGFFEENLPSGSQLWLYAENAAVKLQWNNDEFLYNTAEKKPPCFQSPGNGWYNTLSPGIPAGELVTLSITSYYGNHKSAAHSMLSQIYLGDGSGLYRLMLEQLNFFHIIAICALIAGFIYIVEGGIDIAAGMPQGRHIFLFGFYCLSGSLWCVSDMLYPYLTLVISPPWAASLFDLSGVLLFPIALAAMLRYYMRGKIAHRIMTLILIIQTMVAVLCLLVQALGIADLIQLQLYIGAAALISLGAALTVIIVELWHYRNGYILLLFFTVLPVFISQILDAVNILFPFMPRRTLMQYGFTISVLLLTIQLASYAKSEVERAKSMQQMKQDLEDSHISLMLSQMQPHFLYNSLTGIRQLCDTEPSKASEALGHFAHFLRGNLYSLTTRSLIPFERELAHVEDYLYLEKMRFEERLQFQWRLDYTSFTLPPLTLQPIVENAVRHGITKKDEGGIVTIASQKTENNVIITISDNGIGFSAQNEPNSGRPHIGLDNVRKRLEAQCHARLEINSSPDAGTRIEIILPQENLSYKNTCSRR